MGDAQRSTCSWQLSTAHMLIGFSNDSAAVTHGDRETASGEFSYARARTQQAARARKSDT